MKKEPININITKIDMIVLADHLI